MYRLNKFIMTNEIFYIVVTEGLFSYSNLYKLFYL